MSIKGTSYEKDYEYEGCIHRLIFLTTKVSYQEVCKRNKYNDNGYSFVKYSKEDIKQTFNAAKEELDALLLSVFQEEHREI